MKSKITSLIATSGLIATLLATLPTYAYAQGVGLGFGRGLGLGREDRPATQNASVIGKKAVIAQATITNISGTTLTITKNGITYPVDASTAKLRARFWGQLTIANIQVNDTVSVWGTWTDSAKTSIKAVLIRDLSIQRRRATFFGTISSANGSSSLILNTVRRGVQTVNYVSGPIVDRTEKPITFASLTVGNRIRVRGLWDMKTNTILVDTTQVKNAQIKDFSIPPRP